MQPEKKEPTYAESIHFNMTAPPQYMGDEEGSEEEILWMMEKRITTTDIADTKEDKGGVIHLMAVIKVIAVTITSINLIANIITSTSISMNTIAVIKDVVINIITTGIYFCVNCIIIINIMHIGIDSNISRLNMCIEGLTSGSKDHAPHMLPAI